MAAVLIVAGIQRTRTEPKKESEGAVDEEAYVCAEVYRWRGSECALELLVERERRRGRLVGAVVLGHDARLLVV